MAVLCTQPARAVTRDFEMQLSSTVALNNVYCIYVARWGEDWFESGTKVTDHLSAGTPTTFGLSMTVENPEAVYEPPIYAYMVLAQYDGGVVTGLKNSFANTAIQNGLDWPSAFPSQYLYLSEEDVGSALAAGDMNPVLLAWASGQLIPGKIPEIGESSTLVQFSAAAYGGTATLTLVPEPSSLALVAVGAVFFRCRRRLA